MSTRKASVARPEPPPAAPDVVQQLLSERRELKVANERLRLEIDEVRAAQARTQGKPDRRLALLEDENRRLRRELAALRAENEQLIEGIAMAVDGLERAAAQGAEPPAPA
jgi:DNA repair exonuclease SbcCD ATPase subunit